MGNAPSSKQLIDISVRQLLDALASTEEPAAAGSGAAVAVAIASSLAEMCARASVGYWDEAEGAAAQAAALRLRVEPFAQLDADVLGEAREALASGPADTPGARDEHLGEALNVAARVPLAIAEAGTEVASLSAFAAENGDPDVRADAAAAALFAETAVRVAATLVEVNLATGTEDERVATARRLVATAAEASRRALSSVS